jgi:Glycosyltransferase family 87
VQKRLYKRIARPGVTRRPAGCGCPILREPMKRSSDATTTLIIAVAAVLAAGITLYQLTRPGVLFGITPDISAWLGGSIRLVHGALPYRDFDLTQPPGFALLASPFALLSEPIGTRDALAVLRLCTPLLAAGNVLLIGKVVRHHGRAAVIVACAVMAFFPAELYAIRSGLLEPVVDLFCLAGAALVFAGDGFTGSRRCILAGGVAFGIAGTVKAPAIVPVLVVAVLCLPEFRNRLLPFLGGVVAGFGIPTLPFVLAAPGAFLRDVIGTQLGRIPAANRVSLPVRLGDLTGVAAFGGGAALAVIATIVLAAIVIAAFVLSRRRPAPFEWFAIAATILVGVAQLGPAWYYEHYAAFIAPFLGMLLGISLGRLFERRSSGVAMAIAVAAAVALLVNQALVLHRESALDIAAPVDAVVPAGACTLSDAPSKLVTTDRFVSTTSGCTDMTDPQGATLSYGYGSSGAQRLWSVAVEHADYLVTSTPFAHWYIPPDATLRAYVAQNFRLVHAGGLLFYVRNGFPAG